MKNVRLRLPEEMHQRVVQAARRDRRSVNSEIIALLDAQLQQSEATVMWLPATNEEEKS